MTSPFTHPDAPGGGEKAPRPRDMEGSLVAYSPRIFTPAGAPGNTTGVGKSEPRDRVTADLYILSSPRGPIIFGGSPEYEMDPKPHTHSVLAPARFTGVWVGNMNIVRALAPGGQIVQGTMVLGRIVRSEVGQRPFNLMSVADTPDFATAVDIWSKLQLGALRYNEPTPLFAAQAAPQMPQAQVSYAPPAPPVQVAPTVDAYQSWLASQQPAAVPTPAAPIPPGWTAANWATLNADQQAQVLAASRAA